MQTISRVLYVGGVQHTSIEQPTDIVLVNNTNVYSVNNYHISSKPTIAKSGREQRRERRKKERKNK